jgi:transcriptional regulator with XRE-family HTH domain
MAIEPYTIGRNIFRYRRASTLTQEQLGSAIGVTYQQVQKYENGSNQPSAYQLLKIAEATGFSIQLFFSPLPETGDEAEPEYGKGAAPKGSEELELLRISPEEKRILLLFRALKRDPSRELVLSHLKSLQKIESCH